jgi:hypothetical protein
VASRADMDALGKRIIFPPLKIEPRFLCRPVYNLFIRLPTLTRFQLHKCFNNFRLNSGMKFYCPRRIFCDLQRGQRLIVYIIFILGLCRIH